MNVEASPTMDTSTGLKAAEELRSRWLNGDHIASEVVLNRRPDLWRDPMQAVDVIYEEFCLRSATGQVDAAAEIFARFPQWADRLRLMIEFHGILQADVELAEVEFPTVGELVSGFKIIEVLGIGSRGRVYLATQADLADRHVVLKITPNDGDEHLLLAGLQHTNIVPIHAVVDAGRNLRVICMPFFGRSTLATVMSRLESVTPASRSGFDILRIAGPEELTLRSGYRHETFARAACWIVAAIADALQFAHDRSCIHFDIKPANILIATDGQPLLLDFHLASCQLKPDEMPSGRVGGTRQYMAPEQWDAMQSLKTGRPVGSAVDHRADIFALGAVLQELLGGHLMIDNSQVTVGLADIVNKCLARLPEHRYQTAATLADDLRRHLAHRPLKYVGNSSLTERWKKWRRHRPSALRVGIALSVAAIAAIGLAAGIYWQVDDRNREAERALLVGNELIRADARYADAVDVFERGLSRIESLPLQRELQARLRNALVTAQRLELSRQLHCLAEDVRGRYCASQKPRGSMHSLAAKCREFWQERERILAVSTATWDANPVDDLQDIALFAADLEMHSGADDLSTAHRESLKWIDEAEMLLGPSDVLNYERRSRRRVLGLPDNVVQTPTPTTARANYALGRAYLAAGDATGAEVYLAQAVALEPGGSWPNFYHGLCTYQLGRYQDAVTSFSVCIGRSPHVAVYFHNRSLAYAALGDSERARLDHVRAIGIDPPQNRSQAATALMQKASTDTPKLISLK